MSLLTIRNLTVRFATSTGSFTAVDGIDVRVDKGEVLAIVGESGSGKSVSMLAAMGLLPDTAIVTADEMTFDGRDLLAMTPRQRREIIGRQRHPELVDATLDEPLRVRHPQIELRVGERGGAAQLRLDLLDHISHDDAPLTHSLFALRDAGFASGSGASQNRAGIFSPSSEVRSVPTG